MGEHLRHQLILRCDDAGGGAHANGGVAAAVGTGLPVCVSVMAPGPAFDEAAEVLRGAGEHVSIGLHVTLTSEWATPVWGPVLPADQVRSLLDERGVFPHVVQGLKDQGSTIEEMIAETRANWPGCGRPG